MKTYTREWEGKTITTTWRNPGENKIGFPVTQALGICFTKDGKVLVVRSNNKKWHLPGGHPEIGEALKDTVIREVDEEACVKLSKVSLMGYSEVNYPDNPAKDEGDLFYQSRFACLIEELNELKVDPATGILFERMFISPEEFTQYIKWDDAQDLLDLALEKFKEF